MYFIMGKAKEISPDIRESIVDLQKSGSSLGTTSWCFKVSCSSVQLYASINMIVLREERDWNEHALVPNMHITPKTAVKYLMKRNTLWRCLLCCPVPTWKTTPPRKKPLLQNQNKNKKPDYSLQRHTGTKTLICVDVFWGLLKLKCFTIMTTVTFTGIRGNLASLENTITNCEVQV